MFKITLAIFSIFALTACKTTPNKEVPGMRAYKGTAWKQECTRFRPDNFLEEVMEYYEVANDMYYRTTTTWFFDKDCSKPRRIDIIERKIVSQMQNETGWVILGELQKDVWRLPAKSEVEKSVKTTACGIKDWKLGVENDVTNSPCSADRLYQIHVAIKGDELKWTATVTGAPDHSVTMHKIPAVK